MTEDSIDVLANGARRFIKNPIILAPFICLLVVYFVLTLIEGAILSIYLSDYIGSLFQSTNDIYDTLIMLFHLRRCPSINSFVLRRGPDRYVQNGR